MPPTVDDLRELSKRSRRTQRWGILGLTGAMTTTAALVVVPLPAWAGLVAVPLVGLLLVRFAYVAGEERGAYRRLFRDVKRRDAAPEAAPTA